MRDTTDVILTDKDFFKETEQHIQRIFGNHINPYDVDNYFTREGITGGDGTKKRGQLHKNLIGDEKEKYVPETYAIPKNSVFLSEDIAYLTLLEFAIIDKPKEANAKMIDMNLIPEKHKKAVKDIIDNSNREAFLTKYTLVSEAFAASDEVRSIQGEGAKLLQTAHNNMKKLVTKNDVDTIAEHIKNGLKTISEVHDLLDNTELKCAVRGYFMYHVCEKTLDMLDRNPELKKKVNLNEEDRIYYEGMRWYAKLIREGEAALDKVANNTASKEDVDLVTDYKSLQYLISFDKGVSAQVSDNLMTKTANEISKNMSELLSDSKTRPQYKYVTGASVYGAKYASMKRNERIRALGKCKSMEEVKKQLKEFSNKGVPRIENGQNNLDVWNNAKKTVDNKINFIHPNPKEAEKIKSANIDKELEKQQIVKDRESVGLFSKLEKYVKLLETDEYDKKRHRNDNHRQFQELKASILNLHNYLDNKNITQDPEILNDYIKTMNEKAGAYLNKKDAWRSKPHIQREGDSYAANRYNLALDIFNASDTALKWNEEKWSIEDTLSDIRKLIINDADKKKRQEWSNLSPELQDKAVEFILTQSGEINKTLYEMRRLNLNPQQLAKNIKKDFAVTMDTLCVAKKANSDDALINDMNDVIEGIKKSQKEKKASHVNAKTSKKKVEKVSNKQKKAVAPR